jgi:hypothetical protein
VPTALDQAFKAYDVRGTCPRKAVPTVTILSEVEQAALAGIPLGTYLEVVLKPTRALLAAAGRPRRAAPSGVPRTRRRAQCSPGARH